MSISMFDATNIFLKSNMLAIKKSLHSNIYLNEALSQFLNIAVIVLVYHSPYQSKCAIIAPSKKDILKRLAAVIAVFSVCHSNS